MRFPNFAGLFPLWEAGEHVAGDIYTSGEPGEIWECIAPYDNAARPDIAPGSTAWESFNRLAFGRTGN